MNIDTGKYVKEPYMSAAILYTSFLFTLCQAITFASDGEKENLSPNVKHQWEKQDNTIHQEKLKGLEDVGREARSMAPQNSHPLNLRGKLGETHLAQLKSPGFNKIYLTQAFGPNNHPAFYNGYLKITPDVINPNVQVLNLRGCGLRNKNLEEIYLFQNLEELCLSGNPVNNEVVNILPLWKNLKILHIALTEIDDECLKMISQMPNLVELDISVCSKITEEGIKYLKNSTNLKKLIMKSAKVSPETYQSLQREGLEIIYFPSSGF